VEQTRVTVTRGSHDRNPEITVYSGPPGSRPDGVDPSDGNVCGAVWFGGKPHDRQEQELLSCSQRLDQRPDLPTSFGFVVKG
jgi:hypothetical protein